MMRERESREKWNALLERLTYKPNYRLEIPTPEFEVEHRLGEQLLIKVNTEDTYHPGRPIVVTHLKVLPPWDFVADEGDALRRIRECIHSVELHESDEWLKLDGKMPFDPHAPRFTYPKAGA